MNLWLWLRWQNHLGITLSQLLEHRYHVMHIRLPDRHVAYHSCVQAFLSEQSFSFLSLDAMKLVTQNYQKKWFFSRNTCPYKGSSSEKVAVQNKHRLEKVHTLNTLNSYLFLRKSSSKKSNCAEKIFIFKK